MQVDPELVRAKGCGLQARPGFWATRQCGKLGGAQVMESEEKRQRRPVSRVLFRRRVLSLILRGCEEVEPSASGGYVIQ